MFLFFMTVLRRFCFDDRLMITLGDILSHSSKIVFLLVTMPHVVQFAHGSRLTDVQINNCRTTEISS